MKQIAKTQHMETVELDPKERFIVSTRAIEVCPSMCAIKPDGAKDSDGKDAPSLIFVCEGPFDTKILMQVSLNTLMPAITELLNLEARRHDD